MKRSRINEQKRKRESGLYRQLSRGVCEYMIFELFRKTSTKLFFSKENKFQKDQIEV